MKAALAAYEAAGKAFDRTLGRRYTELGECTSAELVADIEVRLAWDAYVAAERALRAAELARAARHR